MPNKDEKLRRKQILDNLSEIQNKEFEINLPMSRETFQKLFDFLDSELAECDKTLKLTEKFLSNNNIQEPGNIIKWLRSNGGYCDCEVLGNVEELFY